MNNRYGLDANYFKKALSIIVRDADNYTPTEMERALKRLSIVAINQQIKKTFTEQSE